MIKNLHNFNITFIKHTCYCDFWQGAAYVKGQRYSIEKGFLYYTKKDIKKALRQELLRIVNKSK